MQSNIKYRSTCRVCGSKRLQLFLSFADMALHDGFVSAADAGDGFSADLNIYLCKDCFVVQTQHDVDLEAYYEAYQYSVGHSPTARRFMRALADALIADYGADGERLNVVEVGSGDGTQLHIFKQMGHDVIGFEMASHAAELAQLRGVHTIQTLFDQDAIRHLPDRLIGQIDIILTTYTFDHLPEPIDFLRACRMLLNPGHGLLVTEVHDLEQILSRREPGLFQHEHSIYLTRATAQTMLQQAGFVALNFDIIPNRVRRANSLLFVAAPTGSRFSSRRLARIDMPKYQDLSFYARQQDVFFQGIRNLEAFLARKRKQGRRVAGYGAGPRGVITLMLMSNGDQIEYLVDKNPKGANIRAPKSGVPVYGLDRLAEVPVDDVIVFSFGYIAEVTEDLKALGYPPTRIYSMIDIVSGAIARVAPPAARGNAGRH